MTPHRSAENHSIAGSPTSGEPDFLVVGKLRRPHGVRGEIAMEVLTDFPERLQPGLKVFLGDAHKPVHIKAVRWHQQAILIQFIEFPGREMIGQYRNQLVFVSVEGIAPLPEGEYYQHQLLGLNVQTETEQPIGVLTEILETGANLVFVVKAEDGREVLLPDIDEVIISVDIHAQIMTVRLLPGLLE